MINENFIYLAVLLDFLGSAGYIIDTVKGKTKPNKVSWFLWALIPMIAFFAQINQGVGLPALMTFVVGLSPLIIFAVSFLDKKSYWKLTSFDLLCGFFAVLALILWKITSNPNTAILLSIIADFLATLPTLKKSLIDPKSESYNVFLVTFLGALITLLILKNWNFASYSFPLYLLIVCGFLTTVIFSGQKQQKNL